MSVLSRVAQTALLGVLVLLLVGVTNWMPPRAPEPPPPPPVTMREKYDRIEGG